MRHFATESGKSKGQFYTPAEVSRVIAQILGIQEATTSPSTTVYDPTCGSGSLLLKVADEATTAVTLEGQEKDSATSGLARMDMILHRLCRGESGVGKYPEQSAIQNQQKGSNFTVLKLAINLKFVRYLVIIDKIGMCIFPSSFEKKVLPILLMISKLLKKATFSVVGQIQPQK